MWDHKPTRRIQPMMGPTLEAALTTEASNAILHFIAPVAALPTTDLVAAFGAFTAGVSGLALASMLRHPRRSETRRPAAISALCSARWPRVLRHAA
jgi:hypothetical protein